MLNERINGIRLSRMAWADIDDVRNELSEYENALAELLGTDTEEEKAERITLAWKGLKIKGRG